MNSQAHLLQADPLLVRAPTIEGFKVLDPVVLYAKVGTGGMGSVYRGLHLNLGCDVAVKVLRPDLAADQQFVLRFQREARLAVRIRNDNLVHVLDVRNKHGIHYLIMEFVDGETVRERVLRKGRHSEAEALAIVAGVTRGLRQAHDVGIVHRDIKPDNVLVAANGAVKLADLGLAKGRGVGDHSQAMLPSGIIGTPRFMPPEQWRSTDVKAAADIWALGATLWFLLAGRCAIDDGELLDIAEQIRDRDFPDLAVERRDVRPEVCALVARCTRRRPEERFADARELWQALRPLLDDDETLLVDPAGGTSPSKAALATPPPRATVTRIRKQITEDLGRTWALRWPGRAHEGPTRVSMGEGRLRRSRAGILVGGLLAIGLGGTYAWWGPGLGRAADGGGAVDAATLAAAGQERTGSNEAVPVDGAAATRAEPARELLATAASLEKTDPVAARGAALQALEAAPGDAAVVALLARLEDALQRRLRDAVQVRQPAIDAVLATRTVRVAGVATSSIVREVRAVLVSVGPPAAAIPDREVAVAAVVPVVADTFAFDLVAPDDGRWRLELVARDASGFGVDLPIRPVLVDTAAPVVVVEVPTRERVGRRTTFAGIVTDATPTTVRVAGEPAAVGVDGRFELEVELPPGEQAVEVVARDQAGRETKVVQRVRVVDGPPAIEWTEAPPAATASRTARWTGRIADPGGVSVVWNGEPVAVATDGRFEVGVTFEREGARECELVVDDAVGAPVRQVWPVRFDATPPRLELTAPRAETAAPGLVEVAGTVADEGSVRVWVNGVEAVVAGTSWSASVPLAAPSTDLRITARDEAGNEVQLAGPSLRVAEPPVGLDWADPEPDAELVTVDGRNLPSVVRVKGTTMRLRLIAARPAGFVMGSAPSAGDAFAEDDEVPHRRLIRRAFWLGETEVTQAQWQAVVGGNPSQHVGSDQPVDSVSWQDCQAFLRQLDAMLGPAGPGFRLPSEAEWEYACRAGSEGVFAIDPAALNSGRRGPLPVGETPANAWLLRGMHGNVWEWCADVWDAYPGTGNELPTAGEGPRVLRGGSWRAPREFCRAANRFCAPSWERAEDTGFRVARDL
ncbi:MAG: SUMF1/EgtB/PvdO family nonheme iron enzyme [Planctomycetes bacterium]|nr:SUMF1/EgtB/PvdO family nonheme iron enzyme [Planctomycetota bacterium]